MIINLDRFEQVTSRVDSWYYIYFCCHIVVDINTCEREGIVYIKTDCSDKMVVAFTIKEKNYLLVSLFFDVVLRLSYLYLWY